MEANLGGGGGNISDVYQRARKILIRSRDGVAKLERFDSASSSYASSSSSSSSSSTPLDSPELAFGIRKDIDQIYSMCHHLEILCRSLGSKAQRDLWKRKVEQVAEEAASLKDSLDKLQGRQQKRMQEVKERAELMQRANGEGEHVLRIFDDETRAMESARNSHMMIEEAYATGVAVLSKYAEQRDRLKKAQRKALDILNTVGLSNSVLKLIERRHRSDKWIAYAGMVVTVIVVYTFWRWTH